MEPEFIACFQVQSLESKGELYHLLHTYSVSFSNSSPVVFINILIDNHVSFSARIGRQDKFETKPFLCLHMDCYPDFPKFIAEGIDGGIDTHEKGIQVESPEYS